MPTHDRSAQARGASSINTVLGCWLIASPWIFGYTVSASALWNSTIAGVLIALWAAIRLFWPTGSVGYSWINVLLGIWVIASPWIYGYAADSVARWDCIGTGIIVAMLAGWSGRVTYVAEHSRAKTPTDG